MKNKTLKLIAGTFIVSAAFVSGVYAGPTLEQISAYLNKGVTLTWNGEAFYPYEDDGTRVYPITYNGRTYLPVKFVAEKAGLKVGWDAETATVSLTDENYVAPAVKGSYTKVGNGNIELLVSNFEEVAEKGFIVKEKMATTGYDTHEVRIAYASGTTLEKSRIHKLFVQQMQDTITSSGWALESSIQLSDGHYKNVYEYSALPIKLEHYSTDDEVVFIAKRTDILTQGSYKKIGNGQIEFMTDDFEAFTKIGYNVEETLAVSNSDKHTVKLVFVSNDSDVRRRIHIADVQNNKTALLNLGVELVSSTELGNGHYKNVYKYPGQPLMIEVFSSDDAIVFTAYRTDMNVVSQPTLVPTGSYEGYFASVPKPNLDSSWTEETASELKDWSVTGATSYTLGKRFIHSDASKIASKSEEYKNILLNNGFTLYKVSGDQYVYTKGDISVTMYVGFGQLSVDLASGHQAPHYEW